MISFRDFLVSVKARSQETHSAGLRRTARRCDRYDECPQRAVQSSRLFRQDLNGGSAEESEERDEQQGAVGAAVCEI